MTKFLIVSSWPAALGTPEIALGPCYYLGVLYLGALLGTRALHCFRFFMIDGLDFILETDFSGRGVRTLWEESVIFCHFKSLIIFCFVVQN